jgi:SPP1 gp7 family putative phage head morphogenesis protein
VAYFTVPNPLHETLWGPSPVTAAADASNVYINLNAFANQFIERGAIKATLLRVDPSMRKDDKENLKQWWTGMMQGLKNSWQTTVLSNAVEPTIIGEGLADVADVSISKAKAEEVATAMGVPFSVVFSNAANQATAITDQRNFFTYTILPEAEFIAEELNEKVFEPRGLIFAFEDESIKVFQDSEKDRAETYKVYVDAGMKASVAAQVAGLKLPPKMDYAELDAEVEAQRKLEEAQAAAAIGTTPNAANDTGDTPAKPSDTPKEVGAKKEAGAFRRWAKKRIDDGGTKEWTIEDFTATYLDSGQKREIVATLLREKLDDDEDREDDEVHFHPSLKEKLTLEVTGGPDDNPLTVKLERETTKAMLARFKEQYDAVFRGNEGNDDPSTVNIGALVGASTRVVEPGVSARDALRNALVDGSALGTKTGIAALEGVGVGFNYELVNIRARDWANSHAGKLIKEIDTTTTRSVQRSVSEWINNGEPLSRLKKDLESTFGKSRAELIASTEVTRAFAEGNRIAYEGSGIVEKIEWRAANDERVCPICGPLHGKHGDLKNGFKGAKSGFPPAHPRCRCWIVPVIEIPKGVPLPEAPRAPKPPKPVVKPLAKLTGPEILARSPHPLDAKQLPVKDLDGSSESLARQVKGAVDDITRLHSWEKVSVEIHAANYNNAHPTAGGIHKISANNSQRIEIYSSTADSSKTFSLGERRVATFHELGHALDKSAVRLDTTEGAKKVEKIMTSLKETGAYKRLKELEKVTKNEWYTYATSDKELWARAYSQYAAEKIGKEVDKEALAAMAKNDYQWEDKDFAKVSKEFDKFFNKKEWQGFWRGEE